MVVASEDSNIGTDLKLPYVNGLVICAFLSIAWYSKSRLSHVRRLTHPIKVITSHLFCHISNYFVSEHRYIQPTINFREYYLT